MKKHTLFPMIICTAFLASCGTVDQPTSVASVSSVHAENEMKTAPEKKVVVYEEGNDDFRVELEADQLNEDYLSGWAKTLARGEEGYDRSMQTPKNIDGALEGGRSEVILREGELVERVLDASYYGREIQLPLDINEPNVSEDDLENIGAEVIGSFTTSFNTNTTGRVENIRISTESINRVVLGPGDSFSFHEVVGQASAERGYQEANVIVDGEFTNGMGGGICQTSTTLYNAIADAGLDVTERHHHSLPIDYVPEGEDAMVSWGWADLKFQNNHDIPVMITGDVDASSGNVTFNVRASTSL
ncbi:VanW family protein [Geomicrobium sp. JSM 1781026]|uniref:VanW family protein n=1 Tax=Geomicrobium sp. JSM 1781026 TaxID=3344580 RepID=UPI0035C25811